MNRGEEDSATLESLVDDFFTRKRRGDAPSIEAYVRQHPQKADELRYLLEAMEVLDESPGESGGPDGGSDFVSKLLARLRAHGTPRAYDQEGEIARGGQGIVLSVWDEDLQRRLAMKVALASVEEAEAIATDESRSIGRLLEEAQVTAQLDHPGIVPVHELGLDSERRVYFTMKLVKGRDLRTVFDLVHADQEGWSRTRALNVLLKVCEAMAYAHSKGVIHRDLKPGNVMVGKYGEVHVMDWGLARVIGKQDAKDIRIRSEPTEEIRSARHEMVDDLDTPLVTMDGDVVGTPAYMSPEQARGDLAKIGPPSDVYSVGAMLYQLLTGEMPYVPSGSRLSGRAVWALVQKGPPDPVAARTHDVPAELVAICEKAMNRDPGDRYGDIFALGEDLRAYLEQRVVRAYETGAIPELRSWVRRNKGFSLACAVAAVAVLAGLVVSLALKIQSDRRQEDILRLSALQNVSELVNDADALWPAHPENIPGFREWMRRARELTSELPTHRTTLEDLDARLDGALAGQGESQVRWWKAQIEELIGGLESMERDLLGDGAVNPEHGWSVSRRLSFAQQLEAGFAAGGEYERRWAEDLSAIRAAYPDLHLEPQMGLVPVGQDPDSGLWEFAHLMSGSIPDRGDDGRLAITEESGIVLVLLRGGTFTMGAQSTDPDGPNYDPDAVDWYEGPPHEVTVSPFFLSKYEMTQAQWIRATGDNPSYHVPPRKGWVSSLLHPVELVTWNQCFEVCQRLGLSLPREAGWEYGARGGTTSVWSMGDDPALRRGKNLSDQTANEAGVGWGVYVDWHDGYVVHAPVDYDLPNPFGLHGIHGNVGELCLDGYVSATHEHHSGVDPVVPWVGARKHVSRDGPFSGTGGRSAQRIPYAPDMTFHALGLRPARAITGEIRYVGEGK